MLIFLCRSPHYSWLVLQFWRNVLVREFDVRSSFSSRVGIALLIDAFRKLSYVLAGIGARHLLQPHAAILTRARSRRPGSRCSRAAAATENGLWVPRPIATRAASCTEASSPVADNAM